MDSSRVSKPANIDLDPANSGLALIKEEDKVRPVDVEAPDREEVVASDNPSLPSLSIGVTKMTKDLVDAMQNMENVLDNEEDPYQDQYMELVETRSPQLMEDMATQLLVSSPFSMIVRTFRQSLS